MIGHFPKCPKGPPVKVQFVQKKCGIVHYKPGSETQLIVDGQNQNPELPKGSWWEVEFVNPPFSSNLFGGPTTETLAILTRAHPKFDGYGPLTWKRGKLSLNQKV